MTPYYDDGTCVIYHADCREVLPSIDTDAVETVVADPPYNASVDYGPLVDDSMPSDKYAAWCGEWFALIAAPRAVVFPGHGNLPIWWGIRKPSGVGCWYKPGNPASSTLGFCEWEPWLYWGSRVGGSDTLRATVTEQVGVGEHPCPKPLTLYRKLLTKLGGDLVLDPFLGSGTTLRAAKDLNRRAIGIEIEERYCEIAAKRLAQEVLPLGTP